MQPNGKWHIHDGTRPQPRIVTPDAFVALPPPPDAIVLLGAGDDTSRWQMLEGGGPVTWVMKGGVLETGKGMIRTKQQDFTDFQLHVEFATPTIVKGDSQGAGTAGPPARAFEIQAPQCQEHHVPDGQASAIRPLPPP